MQQYENLRGPYLCVALLQLTYQVITLICVEVWWQVGVHAELRAYCATAKRLKSHKQEEHWLTIPVDCDYERVSLMICVFCL